MNEQRRDRGTRTAGWALADQIVVSGTNFATIMLLGRVLGTSGLGLFALAWMVVLFAGSIQGALIVSPLMSLGPQRPESELGAYVAAMWRFQLAFAAVSSLVTLVGAAALALVADGGLASIVVPLTIAVSSYQLQDFVRRCAFVRHRPRTGFRNDLACSILQLGMLSFLVARPGTDSGTATALWVVALAPVVPTLCSLREIHALRTRRSVQHRLHRTQWNYSKWQVGSALLYWVSGNLMVIVSGLLLGTAAVGALTAIQRIVNVGHVVLQSIENVVPTQCAIQLATGGVAAFRTYFRRAMIGCVCIAAAFSVLVAAAASPLLRILAGPEFAQLGSELRLLAPYCVLVAIGLVLPAGLRAFAATRFMFTTSLVTSAFSLVIAWPLIARWGIDGAIVGLLAAQSMTIVLYVVGLRRTIAAYEQRATTSADGFVDHGPLAAVAT